MAAHTSVLMRSLHDTPEDAARGLATLAEAWVRGLAIDWSDYAAACACRHMALPTYPFQRLAYPYVSATGGDAAVSMEQGGLLMVERLLADESLGTVLGALSASDGTSPQDAFKHHVRRLALVQTREMLLKVVALLDEKEAERDPHAQREALYRRIGTLDTPTLRRLLGTAVETLQAQDQALEAYVRQHLVPDVEAGNLSLLRAALIRMTASLSRHEQARKAQRVD